MSTLADSFLDDLDDLDSDGDEENDEKQEEKKPQSGEDDDASDDELDAMVSDLQAGGDLSSVASLRKSEAFTSHMARIEESMSRSAEPILGNVEEVSPLSLQAFLG